MKIIYTINKKTTIYLIVFLLGFSIVGCLVKGRTYFMAGVFLAVACIVASFINREIDNIQVGTATITFEFIYLVFMKRKRTFNIDSIYIEIERQVKFKGGVDFILYFSEKDTNKRIFSVKKKELKEESDFGFLKEVFRN